MGRTGFRPDRTAGPAGLPGDCPARTYAALPRGLLAAPVSASRPSVAYSPADETPAAPRSVQPCDGPDARSPSAGRADGGRAQAHCPGPGRRLGRVPRAGRAAPGARLHARAAHPAFRLGCRGGGAGRVRARVDGVAGVSWRVELRHVALPDRGAQVVRSRAGALAPPRARTAG